MNWELLDLLKKACRGAIAKADKEENLYLPLWMHMADTAGVMIKLYDHRVSEQEKRLFQEQGIGLNLLRKLFALVGMLHDIGKMTCIFQSMLLENLKRYRDFQGLVLPYKQFGVSDALHHSYSGMLILASLGYPEGFDAVIGAHHGRTQDSFAGDSVEFAKKEMGNEITGLYGAVKDKQFWQKSWEEITDAACRICEIEREEIPSLNQASWLLLAGILVEADWISSNTAYFPLVEVGTNPICDEYPERIENGWKQLDLTDAWKSQSQSMTEEVFRAMFGFAPNPVQSELMNIVTECRDPGILVIEAQMGVGKTEASLAAADVYADKRGSGGIYFGLPTQATSNGLFSRFKEWAAYESRRQTQSLKLAHGMASFNEQYRNIPRGTAHLNEDGESSLIVHDWMQGRKVGMMSDFIVGTVDQGLMTALNQRHVMLRHAGIAGKTIIIDEVHAYDAYMNAYLERMLEWLGSYRAPVILLSATLPASRRVQLVLAYQKGRYGSKYKEEGDFTWQTALGYPLFTWTDGQTVCCRSLDLNQTRQEVDVVKKEVDSAEAENRVISDILRKKLENGGVAGIIVNTVQKAQKLSRYLQNELPGWKVIPFHSRFTSLGRTSVEQRVLRLAGKGSEEDRKRIRERLVIVGTQVIEQSLDVDFDLLITELAPMDLLLQRVGRLHRHKDRVRPDMLSNPECYVLQPVSEEANHSISAVYDDWLQYRTAKELPEKIVIPADIPLLVNRVYQLADADSLTSEEWNLLKAHQGAEKEKDRRAKNFILQTPNKRLRVDHGINSLKISKERTTEDQGMAAVRDITPSISCILIREAEPGLYEMIDNASVQLRSDRKLSFSQVQDLLKEIVSLPIAVPFKEGYEELEQSTSERFKVWMENPVLKDRLIMVLDQNNQSRLAGYEFTYSAEYGLESHKI